VLDRVLGSVARGIKLVIRFFWIIWVVLATLVAYGARRLTAERPTEEARERMRGEALARMLERLGATFVKFGQILGTRPDLLGPGYITALSRLHDRVPPAPYRAMLAVIDAELTPEKRATLVEIDPKPVAAASVAQVHRAKTTDGRDVALKVQRPEARSQIERDLVLMGIGARMIDAIPSVSLLSLPGSVEQFGAALRGQLDFRQEARNNRRFAANFAGIEGVEVPALFQELCTERVLAMEFIDGVKATQPEKVEGDRAKLARIGAATILKMVFEDGFVHADLHPGNILLTREKVVLIDLGLVAEIPPEMMRPWVETFLALAQQDGKAVARLMYSHAPRVGTRDYAQFEADVCDYFAKLYGKRLGEVEVSAALGGIMNILRRHRVQLLPTFTVVHIAMLVAEGLGKQLDPSLDVVQLAIPYLMKAMTEAPAGIAPLRTPPT
jgi:ubiquinone biosynthesis protein